MQLHGLHHVTAVTGNTQANLAFYTAVLGLRLVKKTVNQDDVSAYHLFYADKLGSPGTDMTFFDWSQLGPKRRGTDCVVETMLRVDGPAALDYWVTRLEAHGASHSGIQNAGGRLTLRFEDPEGQQLALVDDGGAAFAGETWDAAGIPPAFALRGFFGVTLSVPKLQQLEPLLTQLLGFSRVSEYAGGDNGGDTVAVYAMDGGGPGKEVHVIEQPTVAPARLGRGGVHHVAFRVTDAAEEDAWLEYLRRVGMPNSGIVDRFYFRSLYFRVSSGILFEIATDGPGFATDEPAATMGERLALPPFLEPRRREIEAGLKPL